MCDGLQWQASSCQQEQSDSSKGRRILGLETWAGAEEEEQLGTEGAEAAV